MEAGRKTKVVHSKSHILHLGNYAHTHKKKNVLMPKTFSNLGQCPRTPRMVVVGLGPSTFLHTDFQFVLARRLHNFWFIFCSGFPDPVFFLPGSALHGLFIFAYTYQNIGRTHIALLGCLHRALRYRSRVNWGAGTLTHPHSLFVLC